MNRYLITLSLLSVSINLALANESDERTELELGIAGQSGQPAESSSGSPSNSSGLDLFGGIDISRGSRQQGSRLDAGLERAPLQAGRGWLHWQRDDRRLQLVWQRSKKQYFDGRSPFSGYNVLRLPDNWVPANNTAGMDGLRDDSALNPLRPGFHRDRLELLYRQTLSPEWQADTHLRLQQRSGTRPVAAMMGSTGGNNRSALVAAPVDDQQAEAGLGVTRQIDQGQWRADYRFSRYSNQADQLLWESPWLGVPGWAGAAAYPNGLAGFSLAPDNQAHQFSLSGQYHGVDRLALSARASHSRLSQDETFQPLSVNPDLLVNMPLPADSLNGRIDQTRVALNARYRAAQRTTLGASYRLDDRNNRSDALLINSIGADAINQPDNLAQSRARISLPYDIRRQRASLEWLTRDSRRNQWRAELGQRRHDYTLSDIESSDETSLELQWRRRSGAWQPSLTVEQSQRRVNGFDGQRNYFAGHSPDYLATLDPDTAFVNHPGLRRYHLADRDRRQATARLGWQAAEDWDLNGWFGWSLDDYPDGDFGLRQSHRQRAGLELGWQASETILARAWLSHEVYRSDLMARSFRGGPNRVPDSQNPARDWQVLRRDRHIGSGLSLEWRPDSQRYSARMELGHGLASGQTDFNTGEALSAEPLPNDHSRHLSARAQASWRLDQRSSVRLHAHYERLRVDDWAFNNVEIDTVGVVIGNEEQPGHRLAWLGISYQKRW